MPSADYRCYWWRKKRSTIPPKSRWARTSVILDSRKNGEKGSPRARVIKSLGGQLQGDLLVDLRCHVNVGRATAVTDLGQNAGDLRINLLQTNIDGAGIDFGDQRIAHEVFLEEGPISQQNFL